MDHGHLSFEQIEKLSEQEVLRPKESEEGWSHIENCVDCKSLMEKCQEVNARLYNLRSNNIQPETSMNCPDPKVWFDVLAGGVPSEKAREHLEHAATCNDCGQSLKAATRIFDDQMLPEEESLYNNLPSTQLIRAQQAPASQSTSESQSYPRNEARTASDSSHTVFLRRSFAWAGSLAGVAAAILLAFGLHNRYEIREAERLVASEYQKGRPTDYRVPGVPYGPVRAQRGRTTLFPSIEVPKSRKISLLAAQAALLERDASSAIAILERMRELNDNSLPVLDSLVVAYAMQAEHLEPRSDYEKDLKLVEDILQRNPSDATAYFNQALILERLNRREESLKALQQFLRLEHDQDWRAEAAKMAQ